MSTAGRSSLAARASWRSSPVTSVVQPLSWSAAMCRMSSVRASVPPRQLFGATEDRAEIDGGAGKATLAQILVDMPLKRRQLHLVDLPPAVEQTEGVADLEVVERRPGYAGAGPDLAARALGVGLGHVDGDQRAGVEVDAHRSPRSATSC
jgi:hypothetical protein